jgi:UDP:flavonoid glycosyltransferase YjiC (YdhE family)
LTFKNQYNILICPLEWGLGHAGRMVVLASAFKERQHNVFIGSVKRHHFLFNSEINGLTCIDFKGFKPVYSKILPQYFMIFLQLPVLFYYIVYEHYRLKRIIREFNIDIVISDNRLGLWNSSTRSIYVTHQLRISFPRLIKWLEWTGIIFQRFFIKKFDLCLIPDLPGNLNLTGRLSHDLRLPDNTRFIGILSRFNPQSSDIGKKQRTSFNTLILSGPEPQRSVLRQKVVNRFKSLNLPLIILEGKPGNASEKKIETNIISYNHLSSSDMQKILSDSAFIISRSGYSTVMELISMNRTALLVPTPGQTEQEYLAGYLSARGWFTSVSQKEMEKESFMPLNQVNFSCEIVEQSALLLKYALDEILNK